MSKTESRKQFLKRFGLNITGENKSEQNIEVLTLSEEQLNFLNNYANWLEEFHSFVKKRNLDQFNFENNQRLMQLSEQAETRKPQLEIYMEDKLFATAFNKITQKVTSEINIML